MNGEHHQQPFLETARHEEPSPALRSRTSAGAEPKGARQPARHLPGEEGTWIFILGDMTVFALLFGVYIDARSKDPALFTQSQAALHQAYGAINTLLLLSSSLMVVMAIRAIRGGVRDIAPYLFVGAIVCGLGFSLMKFFEWSDKLSDGINPATNDFWMYYYILTGLHFFHLILGMGVLTFCWVQSRKPSLDARQFAFVEGGACFWHMVDLLWIVLFPLLYLVK
ncbi:MAG: cytochrome c oxidase subunit 3 family protein [Solirubrobacterales bacterium]|nr:cytochrome c oxidase subunit 3 family protein [Solirubrobacterales bacterium]